MLLNLLRERGYDVTQATVSRDINEMNIEKTVSANGVNCYAKAERYIQSSFTISFRKLSSALIML